MFHKRSSLAGFVIVLFCLPSASLAVNVYTQNFEGLALEDVVSFQSEIPQRDVWTDVPPTGWTVDRSAVPFVGAGDGVGVTEFEGWTFVEKNWWIDTAGDQDRSDFTKGFGIIAVADADEWDDLGNPAAGGTFDSKLVTSSISLTGVAANAARLAFDSAWKPEGNQKATLSVSYNGSAFTEVFRWESDLLSANFKPNSTNETVEVALNNPANASMQLEFRLFDAGNNWYWAIDNLQVYHGAQGGRDATLKTVINRDTGAIQIVNDTGAAVQLHGYSLTSIDGAFNEPVATFQANGSANWVQFSAPGSTTDLSEGHLTSQSLADQATINLGNAWRQYYLDSSDITFQYLTSASNNPITGLIEFTGNGDKSFEFLDLNFDGSIDIDDWDTFKTGAGMSLAGLSQVQRYQLGDLNFDGVHSVQDFLVFKDRFDAANGSGAFSAMLAGVAVPEPSSFALLGMTIGLGAVYGVRRRRHLAAGFARGVLAVAALGWLTSSAPAQLILFSEDFESLPLGPSVNEPNACDECWTKTPPAGWTIDDSGVPGVGDDATDGRTEWAGWSFADKVWWSTEVDGQLRETFDFGTGTVMIADPDEWDDAPHDPGLYNTFITTPQITIPAGIPAGRLELTFASSWRPECCDDDPDLANNQTATVKASYNSGAFNPVLTYQSNNALPNFKGDAPNELVTVNLNHDGSPGTVQLEFGLTLAENDWWWAVDNIRVQVPADPSILRVNETTGQAWIVGGDVIPVPINSYEIRSAGDSLNANLSGLLSTTKPDSVDGPDADSTIGNSPGEQWELLNASNSQIFEAFLYGSSTFDSDRTQSLGSIYNTSLNAKDIEFVYTTPFGTEITGLVEYVTGGGLPGDYNADGKVDAADYTKWRDNVGAPAGTLANDVDGGVIGMAQYNTWKASFGMALGAGATAVPEPGVAGWLTLLLAGLAVQCRRRIALAMVLALGCVSTASATYTVDRLYRLGDAAGEGASNGALVGSGNAFGVTFVEMGGAGATDFADLTPSPARPTYATVSGRPDGGSGLGVSFSGSQFLRGVNLNDPSTSFTSTSQGGPKDYQFITDRGFQFWTQPTTSIANSTLVVDSLQHGALIRSGNFAMRYAGTEYTTSSSVALNTWYHVMVVRPEGSGGGSRMYVDGVAVAAAGGGYSADTAPLVIGAATSGSPSLVGLTDRYRGIIDDLEMFVIGFNSATDYGQFNIAVDNDYIAAFKPTNPVDLTGDNMATMDDVEIFVDNWLSVKQINGIVMGDLATRMQGDFNFDGRVDLADWELLNDASPALGAAALAAIQGLAVPEPGAFALALLGLVAWGFRRLVRENRSLEP